MSLRVFEPFRMYGSPKAFTSGKGFLLDARPQVVPLNANPTTLELPGLKDIAPPPELIAFRQRKFQVDKETRIPKPQPARLWNPSIAPAPATLCSRCAYIMSFRVDTLHQCDDRTSPYTGSIERGADMAQADWFQATAIAILDESLKILGWTWLLNAPGYQMAPSDLEPGRVDATMCVPTGSADHAFAPSWAKQTYDARLFAMPSGLLITYACSSCVFSVSTLRVTADPTPSGGIINLRAWSTDRWTYQRFPWLAGRNQALFSSSSSSPSSLYVQSRLGLVGRLGSPQYVKGEPYRCTAQPAAGRRAFKAAAGGRVRDDGIMHSNCKSDERRGVRCGTSPNGAIVEQYRVVGMGEPKKAELITNTTDELSKVLKASGTYGGLSLTSHLVRVSPRPGCDALLGIGHLHRGEGILNKRMYRRKPAGPPPWSLAGQKGAGLRRRQPFAFGSRYTHFWYALQPKPPFATLAVSPEFCLSSPQAAHDCESIQFVTGLALQYQAGAAVNRSSSTLLLTYGVNDCEARIGKIDLERIWATLRPLRPGGVTCE